MTSYYFPPPPFVPTIHHYPNVNVDMNLQNSVTDKFQKELIYWMEHDPQFRATKKYLKNIKGPNGHEIVRKILHLFVRRGNTNWYDLELQYNLVKQFVLYKLESL